MHTSSPFRVMPRPDASGLIVEPDTPAESLTPYRDLGLVIIK